MGIHYHLHHFMVCSRSKFIMLGNTLNQLFSAKNQRVAKCSRLVMGVATMHDLFIKYCAINLGIFLLDSNQCLN